MSNIYYSRDLKIVMNYLTIFIKKKLDISIDLVNNIYNYRECIFNDNFLYKQCEKELNNNITKLKDNIREVSFDDNFLCNDDKCGYISTIYDNGYIKLCNLNKSNHILRKLKHKFIYKNIDKIILEAYYDYIHRIYKYYFNKLFHLVYRLFMYYLYGNSTKYEIKITEKNITKICKEMKNNKNIFKCKYIFINPIKKYNYINIYIFDK